MVREMCGVQFKDRKRAEDLMLMSCLNETTDQLAKASIEKKKSYSNQTSKILHVL